MRYPKIILAVDPGTQNLATCVYSDHIHQSATFSPVRQIKGARPEAVLADIRGFAALFGTLLEQVRPDCAAFERFMHRPGMGPVGEVINVLLGYLYEQCDRRHIEVVQVTASQHKVWLRRTTGYDVQDYPGFDRPSLRSEHEKDAASIALFVRRVWYQRSHELRVAASDEAPHERQSRKRRSD